MEQMEIVRKVTCLLLLFVAYCDANMSFKINTCPRVEVMKSFDMEKFSGVWYVQQQYNPMCSCIKMTIEKEAGGEYKITESGIPFGLDIGILPPVRTSRQLSFPSNKTESIFRMKRNYLSLTPTTYGVVSTDYNNYAALWACDPYLLGSIQNVNIMTRKRVASEDYIKQAKSSLEKFDIDLRSIALVDQSRCSSSDSDNATEASEFNNMVLG